MRLGKGLTVGRASGSPLEIVEILSVDIANTGWNIPGSVQNGDILMMHCDAYGNYDAAIANRTWDQSGISFVTGTNGDVFGLNHYGHAVFTKVHDGDSTITMQPPTSTGSPYLLFGSKLVVLRKPGATTVTRVDGDAGLWWDTINPPASNILKSTSTAPCYAFAHGAEYRSGATLRGLTTAPANMTEVSGLGSYTRCWTHVADTAAEEIDDNSDWVAGSGSGRLLVESLFLFDIT